MIAQPWRAIDGFASIAQLDNFSNWLRTEIDRGAAREVPVASPRFPDSMMRERWIQNAADGSTWRFVEPGYPFRGFFSPLPDRDSR